MSYRGISGFLGIPNAYPDEGISYFRYNNLSNFVISQKFFRYLEVSFKKRQYSDPGIIGLKLGFLPESAFFPALAAGLLDLNDPGVEKGFFLTASKTINLLGLRLHGGVLKEGNFKDPELAGKIFQPKEVFSHLSGFKACEKRQFLGLEKKLFACCELLAGIESSGILDAGARVSLNGIKFEYWKLDLRDRENFKNNRGFMASFGYNF